MMGLLTPMKVNFDSWDVVEGKPNSPYPGRVGVFLGLCRAGAVFIRWDGETRGQACNPANLRLLHIPTVWDRLMEASE